MFNGIKYYTKVRETRDGQREGLLRIKFVIYGTLA